MKMKRTLVSIFLILLIFTFTFFKNLSGQISGYVISYYHHDFTNDGPKLKNQYNGITLKRIYFHYKYTLSEKFDTQITFEANEKNLSPTKNYDIYLKYFWIRWKNIVPHGDLIFGLSQTPVWTVEENDWGYWSVEKTMFDIHNLGPPSDIGIAMKGTFDNAGIFGYHLMIGHGNGYKPETDDFKKYYSSFTFKPTKNLLFELETDYEKKSSNTAAKTVKGFLSIRSESGLIGFETGRRYDEHLGEKVRQGFSLFGYRKLHHEFNILLRFDSFNPDRDISLAKERLFILGLDCHPHKDLKIIPNIWINTYKDPELKSDIQGRITVHFNFI